MRIALTILFAAVVLGVWAQVGNTTERLDPKSTKVALMPLICATGEKWGDLKKKQIESGGEALVKEFRDHGFQIADAASVTGSVTDSKLDFNDEEEWKKDNFTKIANAVGADMVVFVTITESSQKQRIQLLNTIKEGKAKIKIWLLDVKNNNAVLNAAVVEGKSSSGFFGGYQKGSDKQVVAVANAIHDALKDFLKPYPKVK